MRFCSIFSNVISANRLRDPGQFAEGAANSFVDHGCRAKTKISQR